MTVIVSRETERAFAQLYEIQKRLLKGSLNPVQIRDPLQDIIEGNFDAKATDLFASPEQQILNLRRWDGEFGLDMEERWFADLSDPPEVPDEPLVAVTLVPYLRGTRRVWGLHRTFNALWKIARVETVGTRSSDLKADPDHLRLLSGIEQPVGLRWEVINLGANRGSCSAKIRFCGIPPAHTGILAAAAHHPAWVRAMDGDAVPYVDLPGYQVAIGDDKEWRGVPSLQWSTYSCEMILGTSPDHERSPEFAVPVLMEITP